MPPPKNPVRYAEWCKEISERKKGNQYRKGKINTAEHKEKISLTLRGRPSTFKGKRHSLESIEKNRLAHIGKIPSTETRQKMSVKKIGFNNPFYKKKHSDETKLLISKTNTGKIPWIAGKTHNEATKAKLKITRMNQIFPRIDSKPEKILQIALSLRNVKFRKHEKIFGQPDIFIEPNLCIFVDGDYWHRRTDVLLRDSEVNLALIRQGYHILRIWESDIKKDANKCVDFILNFIEKFM